MTARSPLGDGPKSVPPYGSGRTFQIIVLGGVLSGFLFLVGLGVYTAVQYFQLSDTLGGADATPAPTIILAETAEKPIATSALITLPSGPTETATGTSNPTFAAADPAATATAGCELFHSQLPGTPCPAEIVPGIEATATAACAEFRSQFPGTPCP